MRFGDATLPLQSYIKIFRENVDRRELRFDLHLQTVIRQASFLVIVVNTTSAYNMVLC